MIKANAINLFVPSIPRLTFSLRFLGILGLSSIIFLLSFYIFQVYETTRVTFLLSNYQKNLSELAEANKKLEIDYSQNNSLVNLETVLMNMNYEKVDKIQYLRLPGSTVMAK